MYPLQLMILLALFAATSLWAQEDAPESEQAEEAEEETVSPEDKITDAEIDELLGLDEDYTEVEDDDFEASEQIRFGQSIPFPTDI